MANVTKPAQIEQQLERSRRARDQFIERVRNEERFANQDPKGYRRKVFGLVALAYAYIFAVLIFAILLVVGLIYLMIEAGRGNTALVKLILIVGIFVIAVLRSLWVKIDPPDGVILKRSDAPELYREVNAIADRLKAPRPQDIHIDFHLNAAASQTPRLGMFGWYRNTLLLGLPLLLSLSPDEAKAVIAHEFGHFSGAHGKFGAWAYRVDRTWRQMGQQFSSGHVHGAWLFSWFVAWFQPRFAATTFALRRANEYEADRAAAEIAGAPNIAKGLMRLTYLDPYLDETFWEDVGNQAKISPVPPPGLFASMPKVAGSTPESDLMRRHLANAFAAKTDYDDTHPSLSDRLSSLKEMPESIDAALAELSRPIQGNAAEALFGQRLPELLRRVEEEFSTNAKAQWSKQYAQFQERSQELQKLRDKAAAGPLSEDDQVDLAFYTYVVEGGEKAEPIFRSLHETFPNNTIIHYWLGRILAEREDMEAEPLLRRAIAENPKLAEGALQALARLYHAHGEHDKLSNLREEASVTLQTRDIVQAAAMTLQLTDVFEPNGLSPDEVAEIRAKLAAVPKLDVAYLVQKVLPNGDRCMTMIAYHNRKGLESDGEPQKLVKNLVQVEGLPDGTIIFSPSEVKKWKQKLDAIPGSKVYSRK